MGTLDGCLRPGGVIVPSDFLIVGGVRFALSSECPHLRIEMWGTRFCGFNLDVGPPPLLIGDAGFEVVGNAVGLFDDGGGVFGREDFVGGLGEEGEPA